MAATSVPVAKNRMARAIESIVDPWPASTDPIWDFFGSECAYCGVKLVKGERLGHIDHATSKAGNHMGNLVLACSVCNGDEKLDTDWREFLEHKVGNPALRQERIERIERWQALHTKPALATSPEVAAADAELRAMIVAFGDKCAELRAAVADAKNAAAGTGKLGRSAAGSPRETSRRRTHLGTGWAYAGSQRHIQAYVNTPPLTAVLDSALSVALPMIEGATIEWLSPLAANGYVEYQDASFWEAIGQPDLAAQAADWWPARGGPHWDAIALAHTPRGTTTLVLVEAKAHVAEFGPAPCGATDEASIAKIGAAIAHAREQLGGLASTDAWMAGYYQLANRLTWTLWLRDHQVSTVFAHVLFVDDRSNIPATANELRDATNRAHATLGVPGSALAGWAATIVLDATR